MKALQLGINYGMGVRVAVARARPASADRQRSHHPASAALSDVLGVARRAWSQRAMLERVIVSEFDGWPLHISTSPNKRTLYNFPMQTGGAEMLRLAANRLCEADLVPIMLVHDGILFELDNEEQVRARHRDHADGRRRGLRRPRDRRRRRSEADRRRALPRQAAGGEADVGDRDGRAAGDRRATGSGGDVNVLDKTKSYKFVGGKLVERTAEELAELERRSREAEAASAAEDAEIEGAVR